LDGNTAHSGGGGYSCICLLDGVIFTCFIIH